MRIFSPELIKLNYYGLDKKSCLQDMVEILFEKSLITSADGFLKLILERENMMSTGIGKNIAIPHARTELAEEFRIAVFILENELDFDSIDGEPVKIIFMISVPEDKKQEYMKVLSLLSNYCREEENRVNLVKCNSSEEVYDLLKGLENEI